MKQIYDTAIIGGGAIGTATAYFLAKSGQKVLLLERGSVAGESSSKCDGNVQVGDSPAGTDTEMICKSLQLFPQVVKDLDLDVQWKSCTSMFAFETEAEQEAGRLLAEEKYAAGVPMRMLDKQEIHFLEPNLASDIPGGILTDGDGQVNPMLLCLGLLRRAVQYGAVFYTGTRVQSMEKTDGGFLIRTLEQDYRAVNVVAAAGVWTPDIGRMVGIEIPILPRQGQILVTETVNNFVHRTVTEFGYIMTRQESRDFVRNTTPDMEKFGVAALLEPTEGGTLLIGSSRRFDGYNIQNDDRVIRAMVQRVCRFFPKLADIHMIRCYAGLRPYTADHRPILSATPVEGFYIASGHEGSGIALSVITGLLMDELLCGRPLSLDLEPYCFSRFQEKVSGQTGGYARMNM